MAKSVKAPLYSEKIKFFKITTVCLGIFVALLLGEVTMRIHYYRKMGTKTLVLESGALSYSHKPSIKFTNKYGMDVKYNSFGFIGEEISKKKNGTFRILGIGDSITYASYLQEDKRFINRVAVNLSEKTGEPVEVINAGVGGYNTWQEFELINLKGLIVEPDLIIIGVCLNDFVYKKPSLKKNLLGGLTENYRDGSKARYFDFLYKRSDLYKFLYDSLSKVRRGKFDEEGYRQYLKEYNFEPTKEEFEKWKEPFLNMILFCKKNKIKILFVIFPLESQVIKGSRESNKPLSDFFEENNALYLDLMPLFGVYNEKGQPLFQHRDLIHPTELGHKVAAQAIADYIIENQILY